MAIRKQESYESQCLTALALARAYIRREAPYYSTIIYGFVPYFAEGKGTLGVSPGMSLIIDPKWFVEMEKEVGHITGMPKDVAAYMMQAGVLVHEAEHILRDLERLMVLWRSGIDKGVVNKGFDIAINDAIKAAGWLLPAWACYSSNYGFPENLTGEQYVDLFLKMQSEQPEKFSEIFDEGSDGEGKGEGKPGKSQVANGMCGGCAGNSVDDELEAKADAETGRSSADKARIVKEALKQVREAAAAGRGNVPQSLQQLIDMDNRKSVVPWRNRCARVVRRTTGRVMSGRADYSLRRPSKRSWTRGIIRPGMVDKKPVVLLLEDSSGSMGSEQILSVRAEIKGIFRQLGLTDAWFCDIDADVAMEPQLIRLRDLATLPVRGRGGTNFCPGIELALSMSPRPDIVIYLTDGDGPAPPKPPPNMVVIWCIVPTGHGRRPADWGELVVVSDDQELLEPYGYLHR